MDKFNKYIFIAFFLVLCAICYFQYLQLSVMQDALFMRDIDKAAEKLPYKGKKRGRPSLDKEEEVKNESE